MYEVIDYGSNFNGENYHNVVATYKTKSDAQSYCDKANTGCYDTVKIRKVKS